jgi:RecB family exonuclease
VSDLLCPPISNSEIQTFQRCRRKWYLTHVRNLGFRRTESPVTGALAFGTRIHECLERHYADGEDLIAVYEELHEAQCRALDGRYTATGVFNDDAYDKLAKERELAHAMLTGFADWSAETGLDEGLEIVGVETVVEVPSGIPGVLLRGKLDQKVRREIDGAILFRDWKTADNLTSGPQTLQINEQMLFYMLLETLNAETVLARGGLYTMLKKVKRTARANPPFYMQVEVRHNQRDIESMWQRTHARLNDMLTAREQLAAGGDQRFWAYPHPTRDCTWDCPFFAVCPFMDDSSDATWEGLLDATYDAVDPYERYVAEDVKG